MVKVRRRQEGSSVPFPCLSLVLASPSMLRCLPNAQKPALGAKKQKQEVPGGPSITRFFDPRPAGTSPVVGFTSLVLQQAVWPAWLQVVQTALPVCRASHTLQLALLWLLQVMWPQPRHQAQAGKALPRQSRLWAPPGVPSTCWRPTW